MKHNPSQSGSAFFIIILAIAMFAGLSYAVMRGGPGSASSLTSEQARLAAQEIIAYGEALAKTVQTLKLRGCTDTQFNFANDVWKDSTSVLRHPVGHNTLAAPGCGVFLTGEGNLQPVSFPAKYVNQTSAHAGAGSIIRTLIMPGIGNATTPDLHYFLPGIKQEICLAINTQLGISTTIVDYSVGGTHRSYDSPYTDYSLSGEFNPDNNTLEGKNAFCATQGGGTRYIHVLVAR